jgi:integrase
VTGPAAIDTFRAALHTRRAQPKTTSTYLAVARDFIKSAGPPPRRGYTRQHYLRFFGALVDKGSSSSWILLNLAALRRFMRALELSAPTVEPRDLPRAGRKTPDTWIEPEAVARMIEAVLTDAFDDQARCALALATTYGLRASELRTCALDAGNHITIHVAKSGGRTVRQLVPNEIRPYVLCAPVEHGAYWIEGLYHKLEKAAGVKKPRGSRSGFHHIRRALNTSLVRAGVPDALIQRFMRWKGSGFSGPLYYLRGNEDALDREVFKAHPFLALWAAAAELQLAGPGARHKRARSG